MAAEQDLVNWITMVINESMRITATLTKEGADALERLDKEIELRHLNADLGKDRAIISVETGDKELDAKLRAALVKELEERKLGKDGKIYIPYKRIDNPALGTCSFIVSQDDVMSIGKIVDRLKTEIGEPQKYTFKESIKPYAKFAGIDERLTDFCSKVDPSKVNTLSAVLDELKVKHAVLNVNGQDYITCNSKDQYMFRKAQNIVIGKENLPGRVSMDAILGRAEEKPTSPAKIEKIRNLSYTDIMVMENIAKKNNISFAVEKGDGHSDAYNVVYAANDKESVYMMKAQLASIEKSGMMKYYEGYYNAIRKNCEKVVSDARASYKEPFYVMDYKTQKFIEVNRETVDFNGQSLSKRQAEIGGDKTRVEFDNKVANLVADIKEPVILSVEEFQKYQEAQDKSDFLLKKAKENGYPSLDESDIKAIREAEAKAAEIYNRVSQGNVIEEKYRFKYEDLSIPLDTFKEYVRENGQITEDKYDANTFDVSASDLDEVYAFMSKLEPEALSIRYAPDMESKIFETDKMDDLEYEEDMRDDFDDYEDIYDMDHTMGGQDDLSREDY